MLVGLGDDAATDVATAEMLANMFGAAIPTSTSISTPQSTITIGPMTISPAAAPRPATVPGAGLLDVILPKKLVGGKVTIWGLPPAAAYALVAVILAGGGLVAYQHFRGGRRVANGKRRARSGRSRRARYKR